MISSWVTDAAPCRWAVPTQSAPVSPPPTDPWGPGGRKPLEPDTSALGDYRIQVYDDDGQNYQGGFRVHEYRLEPVRLAVDTGPANLFESGRLTAERPRHDADPPQRAT